MLIKAGYPHKGWIWRALVTHRNVYSLSSYFHNDFIHYTHIVAVEAESPVTLFTGESSEAVLECEVYGYPCDSYPPVWSHGSDELHNGTKVTNAGLLSGNSISTTERVVSQLTITNVTANDSGHYTCSWQGNSTTVTLRVMIGESSVNKNSKMICITV